MGAIAAPVPPETHTTGTDMVYTFFQKLGRDDWRMRINDALHGQAHSQSDREYEHFLIAER